MKQSRFRKIILFVLTFFWLFFVFALIKRVALITSVNQETSSLSNTLPISGNLSVLINLFLIMVIIIIPLIIYYQVIIAPMRVIDKVVSVIYSNHVMDHNQETSTLTNKTMINMDLLLLKYNDLVNREYQAEMLKTKAELETLQSQINPHFLYNTLEWIRGKAILADMDDIADMSKSLADFFRYSIGSQKLVLLQEEINSAELYVSIIQKRFPGKYTFIINNFTDTMEIESYKIPRLILQPLIENAIQHGGASLNRPVEMSLDIHLTDRHLELALIDNGSGMSTYRLKEILDSLNPSSDRPVDSQPFSALVNINERIRLHYGEQYGLHLYSAEQFGTKVCLLLPSPNTIVSYAI